MTPRGLPRRHGHERRTGRDRTDPETGADVAGESVMTPTVCVMVLDGDHDNALQVATELSRDLEATIVGVGTSDRSRLPRSRHCDVGVTTVPAAHDAYPRHLLDAIETYRPDVVVPVGYRSVAALDSIDDRLPADVQTCLPPSRALSSAVDKRETLSVADDLDIATPVEYTEVVDDLESRGRPGGLDRLPFPLFLKARYECGGGVTARVEEVSTFWETYDDLASRAEDDEVLVQECVPGDRTYACGLLFTDGSPTMSYTHEECRSVPRQGGSGTRVRLIEDRDLEAASVSLLSALGWNGPALVEYVRRPDGCYVLMEVNPKLWASYALASRAGYRFVSTMVAETLDLPWRPGRRPADSYELVFPLRELHYAVTTPGESLVRSLAAICVPPARIDVNVRDLRAWLTPPADPDPSTAALDTTPTRLETGTDPRASADRGGDSG